jgi:hypothetical protein
MKAQWAHQTNKKAKKFITSIRFADGKKGSSFCEAFERMIKVIKFALSTTLVASYNYKLPSISF